MPSGFGPVIRIVRLEIWEAWVEATRRAGVDLLNVGFGGIVARRVGREFFGEGMDGRKEVV